MEKNPGGIFAPARGVAYETWQVGVERLLAWLHPPEDRPFRPHGATVYSVDRERACFGFAVEAEETETALVERTLRMAAEEWRSRPVRIEAADPGLVTILEGLLAETGIPVELPRDLTGLRRAQAAYARRLEGDPEEAPPGILTGEGVTLAQVQAFAQAAVDYQAAAPWRFLDTRDLLHIEEPAGTDPELRFALLNQSRRSRSILFFRDLAERDAFVEAAEAPDEQWALFLAPLWEIPASDADLWERHGLPRAGEGQLCPQPFFWRAGETVRPDARQLAWLEGLLRALAASSEDDMDSGRWEKEVPTHLGPLRFVLSLPDLLALSEVGEDLAAAMAGEPGEAEGLIFDLLDSAHNLGGRCAVLLARRVLAVRPDHREAWLVLADEAPDPARALELYRRVLALAEQELAGMRWEEREEKGFDGEDGIFDLLWAHSGMASSLARLGRREEAVEHLLEMQRVDPTGFPGEQSRLACLLIELGRDEEAAAQLEKINLVVAGPAYTRVLLAFRRKDLPEARRALRIARGLNPLIPGALLPQTVREEEAVFESEDVEAVAYADLAEAAWRSTPGALTWLADRLEDPGPGPGRKHSKSKPARKKNKAPRPRRKKKKRR
jgi:tetratricopeptide (TPR) repeat protein